MNLGAVKMKGKKKKREEHWDVERNNSTDMGSAVAEGLLLSMSWKEADCCREDHGVGDWDEQDVKGSKQEEQYETVDSIEFGIAIG